MQKIIILGVPAVYIDGHLFKENLEYAGFKVIDISFNFHRFKYKNIFQRARNFYRKTFLGDKGAKTKLKFEKYEHGILSTLDAMRDTADYALIIRPDTYSLKVLNSVRKKALKTVAYQWDGIQRFPWVQEKITYFDRFFVFDVNDMQHNNNFLFSTNFYFDLPRVLDVKISPRQEVYYLANFIRNRMDALERIVSELNKLPIGKNILLYSLRKINPNTVENIAYTKTDMSYEQNIELLKQASVLIDVPASVHNGLSFRTFEALCFEKKLITNNYNIKGYDFYDPQNIFIMNADDTARLSEFIHTPYKKIEQTIKQKYGFTNWIKYILNEPPYAVIHPPTSL